MENQQPTNSTQDLALDDLSNEIFQLSQPSRWHNQDEDCQKHVLQIDGEIQHVWLHDLWRE